VVYANRPGDYFSGHSTIINPMGEILIDVCTNENIIQCEIDLREVYKWRRQERLYKNRRPELYRDTPKGASV
jgi:predicted amidohydrolase